MSRQEDIPNDVQAIDRSLEAMAQIDREAASPGFEDRIALLTAGRIAHGGTAGTRDAGPFGLRMNDHRTVRRRASWSMAAALALFAGAGMLWFGSRPSPSLTPDDGAGMQLVALADDLDRWLEMTIDPYQQEFDLLFAQAAMIGDNVDSDWIGNDFSEDL
ncbi:MAG: hypothetical protein KIT24_00165 [Phycisphaeraceae bacterium]|nr:hypothetical protein [Phycisphaeraceae bacterium]